MFELLKSRIVSWQESRRTRSQLYSLSDRDLHDIGLSRGDIDRVARNAGKRA
jgi:uncharacterized protein YjiS (DUF1127 family)